MAGFSGKKFKYGLKYTAREIAQPTPKRCETNWSSHFHQLPFMRKLPQVYAADVRTLTLSLALNSKLGIKLML